MNFFTVNNGKKEKSKNFFEAKGFIFANKKKKLLKIKIIELKKYF